MKKVLLLAMMAIACSVCSAQSMADMIKKKKNQDKMMREVVDIKPTSADKEQAKEMKADGWKVKAGDDPMEIQFYRARILKNTPMLDEASGFDDATTNRYIMWTTIATAGDESTASAAARANSQLEIASQLETKIAAAMESKKDNQQQNMVSATTVNKFHQRAKAIVDMTLKNTQVPVNIYRVLPNYNCQVQIQVAFDKLELRRQLLDNLKRELEQEGDDSLDGIVNDVLNNPLK